MIDEKKLIEELNRLKKELIENGENTMFEQGRISAFEDTIVFIDTLEVKEVQEEPYVMSDKGKFTTTTK